MPPEEEISPIEYLKLQYRRFVEHSNSDKDPEIYAALAYIPFIGWFFTYFLRPKQSLCVFHAFQSLKITL
ncbi:MAG: hypothetical protein KDK45_15225, partial [Leptospiraceae bacterium]|nr:hypothetical protein [Leptospiraceae bacterium]